MLEPGITLLGDRFTVLRPLGSGGFSETYLAEDKHDLHKQRCVVKRFKPRNPHPDVLQKAEELFKREANVLYQLGVHDRIPRLLTSFESVIKGNQEFFLVQEFVEGHDLTHEIREGEPLPEESVVSILQDVLQTLEFVHQHNAIHRDIKPANLIRRQRDNQIVLIDFGAVKQRVIETILVSSHAETTIEPQRHQTIIGSPGFVAPEQSKGRTVTASDIYSLGMVGITALTGIPANHLPKDSNSEVLWRDCANVNPRLADVLGKMVRHHHTERYQTVTEALQALNAALQPAAASSNRSCFMPPLALGLVASLLFGGVVGYWIYSRVMAAGGGIEVAGCPVPDAPVGPFAYGGSTTWAPIQRDANPKLEALCPQFHLRYTEPPGEELPGSSTGIRMLQQGQIDFALSSRPLETSENQDNQGVMLKQIGVAIDGIAVAVHPDLEIPGLTVEQVRDIYTGQITDWRQVGAPYSRPITPYSRELEAGGTVEFFVQSILQGQPLQVEWVSRTTEGIQKVSADPGGIYYASAPEVIGQCGVKPLSIGRQPSQLIAPYQEPLVPPSNCPAKRNQVDLSVLQAGEYPITRKLFVVIKENGSDEQRAGEAYVGFLLTPQGQELIEQAGFVRIR